VADTLCSGAHSADHSTSAHATSPAAPHRLRQVHRHAHILQHLRQHMGGDSKAATCQNSERSSIRQAMPCPQWGNM